MITEQILKSVLNYNPNTGIFIWIKTNRRGFVGKIAGSKRKDGYLQIKIGDTVYLSHRLAFLYSHGYMSKLIDHIDGNKTNNVISNLRVATKSQNNANKKLEPNRNTSGFKGVSLNKATSHLKNPWRAYIMKNKKRIHIGMFSNPIEAAQAYDAKALELFGEFAKLNFPKMS